MYIRAKKQFGQNFLSNSGMQNKVVAAMLGVAELLPEATLLEIGPGRGDITKHLLKSGKPLMALEIDSEAIAVLSHEFVDQSNFTLVHTDALKVFIDDEDRKKLPKEFVFVSSLPYNVGSRILMDLPVHYPHIPFAVILQFEVVKKLHFNSSLTMFGAWLGLFWDIKKAFEISPGNFTPVPKVMSAMMIGTPKQSLPEFLRTAEKRLAAMKLLKSLFAMPSKTIENNLKAAGLSSSQILDILDKAKVAKGQRLGWDNYLGVLEAMIYIA